MVILDTVRKLDGLTDAVNIYDQNVSTLIGHNIPGIWRQRSMNSVRMVKTLGYLIRFRSNIAKIRSSTANLWILFLTK